MDSEKINKTLVEIFQGALAGGATLILLGVIWYCVFKDVPKNAFVDSISMMQEAQAIRDAATKD
mgnify:CR=1 FL=1